MFFNESVIPCTEPLPGQLSQYRSCRKIHSYVWFKLIKEISSQFAEKKTWKNTDLSLKYYFRNKYLLTETLKCRENPIFGGFENRKSGLFG